MSLPEERHELAEVVRARGARATPARLHVLAILRGAARALSHHDIEAELADRPVDRVTLYRVLDWAVGCGLVLRSTDEQRTFRFSLAVSQAAHRDHAHFNCDKCGKVYCLEAAAAPVILPIGFRMERAELAIHGRCANCATPPDKRGRSA